MTRRATIGILVALTSLLIAWDVWVFLEPTPGDTVSEVVLAFARAHPPFPFLLGVVCGHLLWSQRLKE